MRLRSKAREIALNLLYQIEVAKIDFHQAFQNYLENYLQDNLKVQELKDFSFKLIEGVVTNLDFIDSLIKKYVRNWEIDRLAVIDRNILRMACFELLFMEEIPPKVSINEAIELAKCYGDIDSPRFVNGILDKIYKTESPKVEKLANKQKSVNGENV